MLCLWYMNYSNSARFLWKTIPGVVKESKPEVGAAWRIGQRLWTRDYAGVYQAVGEFDGSPEARDLVASFAGSVLCLLHSVDNAIL